MSESTRELGFYTKEKSTKAFITNVASVSIPRGYRAHQMSEFLCSVPELTLVLRSRPKWPVTAPRPGCVQRGRGGGKFHPEHNSTNGKGVTGGRTRIAKANRSRAKGGGLNWAGIREAPREQVPGRPLRRITL